MGFGKTKWKKLLLFCLGLTLSSAFCMKWMEADFWVNDEKFTIMGLELFYTKEKVINVLSGIDEHVKTILSYHLHFDFVFMAGVYPGITALCMMAKEKVTAMAWKKLLYLLALIQLLALAGDIIENLYLLTWLKQPVIGNSFGLYHFVVSAKWIIALMGALVSIPVLVSGLKRK